MKDNYFNLLNKLQLVNNNSNCFFQLIWTNSLMFFTQHNYFRDYYVKNKDIYIPNIIKRNNKCIIFSSGANWYWNDNKYRTDQHELTVKGMEIFIKEYPNIRLILMHPDETFIEGYPKCLEYLNFNRNALIDINSFNIIDKEKKFDSIYNSNFYAYKQHYLLEEIDNYKIALIYYHRNSNLNQAYYIKKKDIDEGYELEKRLLENKKFTLLNMANGKYKFLSKKEINEYYNESYSGLCLSDIEGACLVSVEYLLSGLPVISVKNVGGRDKFLKQMGIYAITDLNYNINEIEEAIQYYKNKNSNKEDIRNKILSVINKEWETFFNEINKLNIDINNKVNFKQSFINAWNKYKL